VLAQAVAAEPATWYCGAKGLVACLGHALLSLTPQELLMCSASRFAAAPAGALAVLLLILMLWLPPPLRLVQRLGPLSGPGTASVVAALVKLLILDPSDVDFSTFHVRSAALLPCCSSPWPRLRRPCRGLPCLAIARL
jgi:hypothetical protein